VLITDSKQQQWSQDEKATLHRHMHAVSFHSFKWSGHSYIFSTQKRCFLPYTFACFYASYTIGHTAVRKQDMVLRKNAISLMPPTDCRELDWKC